MDSCPHHDRVHQTPLRPPITVGDLVSAAPLLTLRHLWRRCTHHRKRCVRFVPAPGAEIPAASHRRLAYPSSRAPLKGKAGRATMPTAAIHQPPYHGRKTMDTTWFATRHRLQSIQQEYRLILHELRQTPLTDYQQCAQLSGWACKCTAEYLVVLREW